VWFPQDVSNRHQRHVVLEGFCDCLTKARGGMQRETERRVAFMRETLTMPFTSSIVDAEFLFIDPHPLSPEPSSDAIPLFLNDYLHLGVNSLHRKCCLCRSFRKRAKHSFKIWSVFRAICGFLL
jgi:hypothetical protein